MRRLVLLGLVLTLASGCGRGWLPMFRGAKCHSGICGVGAPALPATYDAGCSNCGHSAGYNSADVSGGESYSGISNADSYYGGDVVQGAIVDSGLPLGSYPSSGAITSPPMRTLPQAAPTN